MVPYSTLRPVMQGHGIRRVSPGIYPQLSGLNDAVSTVTVDRGGAAACMGTVVVRRATLCAADPRISLWKGACGAKGNLWHTK
eukprot:scaffold16060_cov107-Isochrysis_galbana.AAC.9